MQIHKPFSANPFPLSPLAGLAILVSALFSSSICGAGDWAFWRGPTQNGVSPEKNLPTSAKEFDWRVPLGGHSTVVIYKGRVFGVNLANADNPTMEQEQLYCVDLATGKTIWRYHFNCFHTDVADSRVGWSSPTVDPETGYIYVNGVQGLMLCLDQEGQLIWSKSLGEHYGRISGYGGRTYTPMIDEDRVIVAFNNMSFGAHSVGGHRFLALDKRTGEIVWWASPGGRPEDPTYSNPIVATIGGERMVIAGNADGSLYAIKARTGEKIWGFMCSRRGLNSSPVVDDYRVIITHSEENIDDSKQMGRVICIDGRKRGSFALPPPETPKPGELPKPVDMSKLGDITKTGQIWMVDGIDAGFASPLLHNGRVYIFTNTGILFCLESATGKTIWKFAVERGGKGSPVWGDGKIYVTGENGRFAILEDAGDHCKLIDSYDFKAPERRGGAGRAGAVQIFASPAVADGHIVFPTTTELVCIGSKEHLQTIDQEPPVADEGPAEKTPATVQVRPAEVLLTAGDKVQFEAIAFDKLGRRIGPMEAKWSFKGMGSAISPTGEFTAGSKGSIGEVVATAGDIKGEGRVRITPNLPISEDFESYKDGDTVPWWVGATKTRFNVVEKDHSKVLKKLADDRGPIFNRALVYITPPIEPGYTVEADVQGDEKKVEQKIGKLTNVVTERGDAGLVNDRYVFELCDNGESARVVSWMVQNRFEKKIDYPWEAGKWYRLKLYVTVDKNEAKVMAKVWPRGDSEPKEWTIEATDPSPNVIGAVGIYANSVAPLYFDNVKVTR